MPRPAPAWAGERLQRDEIKSFVFQKLTSESIKTSLFGGMF